MQEVSAEKGMPLSIETGGTGHAIPDWVRNNFEWYVNGQIDEKTLLTSMNWMFDNNVMHLSEKAAIEVQELRDENIQLKEKMKLVPIPEALPELPGFEPEACSSNDQCHSDTVCRDGFCQKPCAIQCFQYTPVCGEDGKTYSCGGADAACWGVDVDYDGECKRPDVSCPSGHIWIDCAQVCIPGRDTTCPSGMTMDPTTGKCRTDDSCPDGTTMDPTTGVCRTDDSCPDGTYMDANGVCRTYESCPSGKYMDATGVCRIDDSCPSGTSMDPTTGQCTDDSQSCVCTDVWEPVCGTDGKTYGNKCEANCADAKIEHEGECRVTTTGGYP